MTTKLDTFPDYYRALLKNSCEFSSSVTFLNLIDYLFIGLLISYLSLTTSLRFGKRI